ncbi:MAG: preprotein translocase subunit SecG [Candidatus Gracilibacteria bacterium]
MSLSHILLTLLIITSAILILLVLLQPKQSGLSLGISSSGEFAKFERRGVEKVLHNATIIITVMFVVETLAVFFFV